MPGMDLQEFYEKAREVVGGNASWRIERTDLGIKVKAGDKVIAFIPAQVQGEGLASLIEALPDITRDDFSINWAKQLGNIYSRADDLVAELESAEEDLGDVYPGLFKTLLELAGAIRSAAE